MGPLSSPSASHEVVGPADRPDVTRWLSRALRPDKPGWLIREYPQVFLPSSPARFITQFDGDRPVAHATLLPARIRCDDDHIEAALISHVYTSPDARGQGRAKATLEAAHQEARRLGLDVAILWSEFPGLYERLGYVCRGRERLVTFSRSTLVRASQDWIPAVGSRSPLTTTEPDEADWLAIEALRTPRRSGLELDRNVLLATREIPELEARVAKRDGRVVGFALLGRGDDFRGVVHEWGGPAEAVFACCEGLLEAEEAGRPEPLGVCLSLLAPADPSDVTSGLLAAGADELIQPLARMKDLGENPPSPDRLDALFIWGLESI